jgi:SAM-dependent methyltransferase
MDRAAFALFAKLEQRHWWFRGRRALYVPLLGHVLSQQLGRPPNDMLIADVGCGVGGFLEPLEQFGSVIGLELDLPAIEWCRQRGHDATLVGRCDALPIARDGFDLVTMWDVLEHTPDDGAVLSEVLSVLKPGGHLALSLPAYPFLYSNNDKVAQHYRRYTRGGIRRLLAARGWEVVKATYVNVLLSPLIIPAVLALKLKQKLLPVENDDTSNLSVSLPSPLNNLLARLFAAELPVLRHVSAPFGHSLFVVARRPGTSST